MWRNCFPAFLGGILAVAFSVQPARAADPIAPEDLVRLPALQSVSMSADGRYIAALIPSPENGEETALATWDTAHLDKGPKVVTPSGERMKFIGAAALKAGKVLAFARQEWTGHLGGCGEGKVSGGTKTFVHKTYLTGIEQKKFDEAFTSDRRALGVSKETERCLELVGTADLEDTLPLDPEHVIIRRSGVTGVPGGYYRYNLKTNRTELLFQTGGSRSPMLLDPRTGKLLAEYELKPEGGDYKAIQYILDPASDQLLEQEPLTTKASDRYTVSVLGVDEASGKYWVLTDQFSDHREVWLYDAKTHKYDAQAALAHPQYSIASLVFGRQASNFNQVVGFTVDGPWRQTVYIEPKLKAIQDSIEKALPGQQVRIGTYTDDYSRVLFSASSASVPGAWYLLENGKDVKLLGVARPWLDPHQVGTQRWVTYKARDGLEIPAILDLPAGWSEGDAAATGAIVMPHGGPWARDYMGWDGSGWVPLLTSRGYAVLRPQYRGSSGLGRELWLAGDAEWGQKMSDDLDDGAAWLVEQGYAQKDRLAIFGYSYGGFAAAAAIVRNPSPFRCAISGAPVTDLGRLGTTWSSSRLQRILQGQTVKGMDPQRNADKAHLPILLFVGDRDVRTPGKIHAERFYKAVKDKVPAQMHWIADQSHSMPWYPRQQRETLQLITDYLAGQCGFGRPATAATEPTQTTS